MPSRAAADLLSDERPEHPALKAWSELRPQQVKPKSIELLKGEHSQRTIYRLEGVGRGGASVIAKKSRKAPTLLERAIYEQVLPHLSITAPHYYGFVEGDDEFGWLFLEELGGERFSPILPEHRRVAARWLAAMHTGAEGLAAVSRLPDRGPGHYLDQLRAARSAIEQALTSSHLDACDRTVLRSVVSQCEVLEHGWDRVEKLCERMPRTLVHGDFRPKNVRLRTGPDGLGFYPFDWEMAGRGVPAPDLAPSRPLPCSCAVDLNVYHAFVSERWPGMDLNAVHLMETVGRLFRVLAAVNWASGGLGCSPEKPLASMKLYEVEISQAAKAIPWSGGR